MMLGDHKSRWLRVAWLVAATLLTWHSLANSTAPECQNHPMAMEEELQPAMVIIIDDLGNARRIGEHVVALPGPVTLSILPHTPFAQHLARLGHDRGKEVMLHVPMSNHGNVPLGSGALTLELNEAEFKLKLQHNLAAIPFVQGFNNHTGSALTEVSQPMHWTMQVAQAQQLFFVDSRTTANSIAAVKARELQVPYLERDIFLDNRTEPEYLQAQFDQAKNIAQRYGAAILIGHPHQNTIRFLQQALPQLDEAGIQLVAPSALLHQQQILLGRYLQQFHPCHTGKPHQ